MKVLVIAAHPDDEVLGCGATIAKHAAQGDEVRILILGEGATSRFAGDQGGRHAEVSRLREQARSAAAALGAVKVLFGELPDNRFDSVDLLTVVRKIEEALGEFGPETVYTQSGGDLNIDHALAFRATLTAVRPMVGSPVQALYCYEIPSSTEWAFGRFPPVFEGDYFVDITDYLERKLSALALYDGELKPFPHPRSPRGVRALAEVRGMGVGMVAAEAFATVFRRG